MVLKRPYVVSICFNSRFRCIGRSFDLECVSVYGGAVDEPCSVAFLIVQSIRDSYPSRFAFGLLNFNMIGLGQFYQFFETPHLVFLEDAVQHVLQIILRSLGCIHTEL